MGLLEERVCDRRVLKLLRQWLEAGVLEDGSIRETLAGWGNYFATGNADDKFNHIDDYVRQRLWRWLWRRGGQRRRLRPRYWPPERYYAMGLYRLQGTVRYPSQARLRRPSVSRVPEIGTHGLKGGPTVPASNRARRP